MKLPFVSKTELERLCKEVPTPFHLYDETIIRQRARQLKTAFDWNPGFREYFAVKANPNPVVLKILIDEGFGLDCSSYTELLTAGSVGAKGHDIMFSSNVTPAADMRLAMAMDSLINLDDISHIDFLDRLSGIPRTISLRFNPGNDFTIGNSIMSRPGDAKYGFTRPQLTRGIRELQTRGPNDSACTLFYPATPPKQTTIRPWPNFYSVPRWKYTGRPERTFSASIFPAVSVYRTGRTIRKSTSKRSGRPYKNHSRPSWSRPAWNMW